MKVVALLSGGKDSCYTILKARLHGHDVVALAHITPPEEEPDSFMYQSVASNAVVKIAESLNIPLFTSPTKAKAKHVELTYTPTVDDEVEDLFALLIRVKNAFPGLQAVCAGALWSDYQRLRVESAVSRLGMLSMAYLWRRNQSDLLDEMIHAGVQAVLVKVAGIGLNHSHLGKSLEEMRPTLRKMHRLYGSHICGEGGEYETLVLWMPGFESQLVLDEVEVVHHSNDPVAPVSYLRIVKSSLRSLSDKQRAICMPPKPIAPPPFQFSPESIETIGMAEKLIDAVYTERCVETNVASSGNFSYVSVRSPHEGKSGLVEAASHLKDILSKQSQSLSSVVYVMLHLNSVSGSKYAEANSGYNSVFGIPECTPPPSRACVGSFSNNHPTILEALIRHDRNRSDPDSFTLHVQSLSEWAPPCIGPYAQLIEEDGVVHICGVLPLYAPFASILEGMSVRRQVEACIYNLGKTLEASRIGIEQLGLFLVYVVVPNRVEEVWEEMNRLVANVGQVIVLLPVSELPKGGLVEIRAIGALKENELHRLSCMKELENMEGIQCESIVCSKLGFVVMTLIEDQVMDRGFVVQSLSSLNKVAFNETLNPFFLKVYITGIQYRQDLERLLTDLFPNCCVSVLKCDWMPRRAGMICLATYELQEDRSQTIKI